MVVQTNYEESESDKAIEYYDEFNCLYFPPPPPYYPLSSPPQPSSSNSGFFFNEWFAMYLRFWPRNQQLEDIQRVVLGLYAEFTIQERGGVLDVIPGGKLIKIDGLEKQHDDIIGCASEELAFLVEGRDDGTRKVRHIRPVDDSVEWVTETEDATEEVQHYLIQYRGGAVDMILGSGVLTYQGLEVSDSVDLPTTLEPPLILQTKCSIRVWHGHCGEWGAEFRFEWNWLNIGTFKIAGAAALTNEWVLRCRGGKAHIDFPFPELSLNKNREEPTTARITEIPTLELPPTTQQENPDDEVEAVGIGSWNCCDSTTIQGSQSSLKYACWEYGIHIWPPQPHRTPMLVDQEEIPLLYSDTLPSDQALAATVDINSVLVEEIPRPLVLPIARQENLDENLGNDEVEAVGIGGEGTEEDEIGEAQLHTGCFGKRKWKGKSPRGERGNKKTTRVRNVIPLEEILQIKGMHLKDAARHLNVSQSTLKLACREYGINRWPPRNEHKNLGQSLPNETPTVVNQEGIPPLTSDTLPSDNTLAATVDTNNVVEEIPPPQFSPTAPQENAKEDLSNDELHAVGVGGVGTREGDMKEAQLNTECSGNGKRDEKIQSGDRGSNKATGVRIAIHLEDILQMKGMHLKDAAKHLKVSRSTLKRACREYNIYRWPPREELINHLSQYSLPNKSPTVADQGRIPQLNYDTLLTSYQVPTTVNTNSVIVKARYGKETIKFRLSSPWGIVELKQQVKKRLELEDGTYYIRYKDEDDELILIACDDDLQDCISSSSPLGTKSVEILLEPK